MFYFVENKTDNYTILNFIFKLKYYYQNTHTILLASSLSKRNKVILKVANSYAQRFFKNIKMFDKHMPLFIAKFYSAMLNEKNILVYFNYLNGTWEIDIIVNGKSITKKEQFALKKLNVDEYLKKKPNENVTAITKLVFVESLIEAFIQNYKDQHRYLPKNYKWKNIEIICLQDTALEFYNTLFKSFSIDKEIASFTSKLDSLSFLISQTKPDYVDAVYLQSLFPGKIIFVIGSNGEDVCMFYKNVRYRIYDFIYNSKYRIYPWKTTIPFLKLIKYAKEAKDKNVISFRWFFNEYIAYKDLSTFNFMIENKMNFKNRKIVYFKWMLFNDKEIANFLNSLNKKDWVLKDNYLLYRQPSFSVSLRNYKVNLTARLVIHKQVSEEDINTIFNFVMYNILKNFDFNLI